jgi:hypothetical protein
MNTVCCKKKREVENCQNKTETFLQFFHSVKPYERLTSKFNDIFKNYVISRYILSTRQLINKWTKPNLH